MSDRKRKQASFVVHLWQEPREIEGQPPVLRGSIEILHTQDKRYFADLETLVALILEVTSGLSESENGRKPLA